MRFAQFHAAASVCPPSRARCSPEGFRGDEREGTTIRRSRRLDGNQLAGMLCFLIFLDNLLW
jgi:hypothetical protein